MSELYLDNDEQVVWSDYRMIFSIPYPFTKYTLTTKKLYVESGIIKYTCEEIKLFRVCDISVSKGIFERICNTGSITIKSNDKTNPTFRMGSIKDVGKTKQALAMLVERDRERMGFRTGEFISG